MQNARRSRDRAGMVLAPGFKTGHGPSSMRYLPRPMRPFKVVLTAFLLILAIAPAPAVPTATPAERPRCTIATRDPDTAIRHCTEAIASGRLTDQGLAAAYAVRGLAHRTREHLAEAIADLSTAIDIDALPALIVERGKTYAMARRHQEAIADFETASRRDKTLGRMFEETAEWFADGQYFTEAIPYLDAALKSSPDNANLIRRRGDMAENLGQHDEAIRRYDTGLRIAPNDPTLHASRAVAFMHKREYDRALGDLDHALQIEPKSAFVRYTRARALFDLARFGEAADEFGRAMQDGRQDSYAAIWRYLALHRSGKDGTAELRENVRKVDIEQWPAPAMALMLGTITPERLLAIALDAEPRTARNQRCEALFFIGEYHLLAGRTDKAIAAFEAAVGTGVVEFVEYWHAKAELQRLRR